jgi:hypothetical protein
MWSDRMLRAIGVDPWVFRPVYRAQRLMLSRSRRLVRMRGGSSAAGYGFLFLYALIYGMLGVQCILMARQPLLGGGLAISVGCIFLLMVVLADHADTLVHPGERLVLAAHPHDDRSFLLAQLAAIGGSLSLLSIFLFGFPFAGVAYLWGLGAAAAFLIGAAGAAIAVAVLGLLVAVSLVRLGGRRAMERVMPWTQGVFALSGILPTAALRILRPQQLSPAARGLLSWLLPSFWFTAPLELAAGRSSPAAGARLALAAATLALVAVAGVRLAAGLGRRLLEPEPRPAAASRGRATRRPPLPSFLLSREGNRLFNLLRVHLRSDWRTRSDVMALPATALVLMLIYSSPSSGVGGSLVLGFYGWVLILAASTLTRSRQPEKLWWVLSSPIDRTRFSLATIHLSRFFMLFPLTAAVALLSLRQPSPGGSWPLRLLSLLALLAYGDLLLVLGKAMYPAFPFSRAVGRAAETAGGSFLRTMIGVPITIVGTTLIGVCQRFGVRGVAYGGAAAALLHLPAYLLARHRTRHAAVELDLATLG